MMTAAKNSLRMIFTPLVEVEVLELLFARNTRRPAPARGLPPKIFVSRPRDFRGRRPSARRHTPPVFSDEARASHRRVGPAGARLRTENLEETFIRVPYRFPRFS